jgi:hypothetical protein
VSDLETDQGNGLWVSLFGKLSTSLDGLSTHLRRRNRLDQWATPVWRSLGSVSGAAAAGTGPLILNLGTPPVGYYWKVRSIQVVGLAAANGNPTYTASVVCDVYITSQSPAPLGSSTQAGLIPPLGDWYLSNLTTSSNPTSAVVPWERNLGSDEMSVQSGDNLMIVLTGAGVVTTTTFIAGAFVHQYQGLSEMGRE